MEDASDKLMELGNGYGHFCDIENQSCIVHSYYISRPIYEKPPAHRPALEKMPINYTESGKVPSRKNIYASLFAITCICIATVFLVLYI